MNLILLSLFCCCLLVTLTPGVDSAKLNLSQILKSAWLQRAKRDLNSLESALREAETRQFVRPEDVKDSLLSHSSAGHVSERTKRSKLSINQSRRPGCALSTCTVHDLTHRLQQLNNRLKSASAPIDKISPLGYGRRRRSVPERRMTLEREEEGGRLRPVWRLQKLEALLRRT
ncbi:adrenomedullin a [Hoplias malabaricus]|uniref:adrenomedullin a n=1 Tax=Hoplias malabaricus TaxID=27720 RepID=UPI00346276F7